MWRRGGFDAELHTEEATNGHVGIQGLRGIHTLGRSLTVLECGCAFPHGSGRSDAFPQSAMMLSHDERISSHAIAIRVTIRCVGKAN